MSLDRYYCDDPQVMSLESPTAPEDMKGQWVLAEDAEAEIAAKDEALGKAVEAMERSVREGFTDHLDDGGEFWYAALTACREAMKGEQE